MGGGGAGAEYIFVYINGNSIVEFDFNDLSLFTGNNTINASLSGVLFSFDLFEAIFK